MPPMGTPCESSGRSDHRRARAGLTPPIRTPAGPRAKGTEARRSCRISLPARVSSAAPRSSSRARLAPAVLRGDLSIAPAFPADVRLLSIQGGIPSTACMRVRRLGGSRPTRSRGPRYLAGTGSQARELALTHSFISGSPALGVLQEILGAEPWSAVAGGVRVGRSAIVSLLLVLGRVFVGLRIESVGIPRLGRPVPTRPAATCCP
jgi:hypothetical protein